MDKFVKFAKITKLDDEERMVYGWASTPDLDSDGEVIELAAIKNALPGYMEFPTLREMHQPKVAGRVKSAEIRDGKEKGLYIAAKVMSDEAWKLVKEGAYSAFSIGGNVLEKVANVIKSLELVEISLVDVPANKAAVIEVWKNRDLNKDASGVSNLTYLMNEIRMCKEMWEQQGKKTNVLDRMLEQVKTLIAAEASEPEMKEKVRKMANALAFLTQENLKGGENKMLNKNAKGVTETDEERIAREAVEAEAAKKAERLAELKEEGKVLTDEEKKELAELEGTAEEKAEDKQPEGDKTPEGEGEKTETEETEEKTEVEVEGDGAEDAGEKGAESTLEKLAKMNEALEKIAGQTADVEKLDLAKTVNALAGTLSKVVTGIQKLEERLTKVEATPAATKSRTAFVEKTIGSETENKVVAKSSPELETKLARYEELKKLLDTMGANEFAKAGYSMEAGKLEKEIAELRIKLG